MQVCINKNLKKILLIIGILIGFSVTTAYASDCDSTLYENEFKCQSEFVYSYCTLSEKLFRKNAKYNLYESAYCNTARDSDKEIYKAITAQFKAEDPKWDEDSIKFVLTKISTESIEDFLKDKYGNKNATNKLPTIIQNEYLKGSFDAKHKIYQRVKQAYERQKVIHQSKESLKQQFENREMWANGSLNDSPFDLVVDLNLIEKILFGSRAEWVDPKDVWKWPKKKEDKPKTPADNAKSTSVTGGQGKIDAKTTTTHKYVCVPDDLAGCGNGVIDGKEECDDGNKKSGDGCNASCEKEKGTSLQCKDNSSVTFKTFSSKKTTSTKGDKSNNINCPPGFKEIKKTITTTEKVTQSVNYPGPYLGGVLKNFPPSNKTKCPPGSTWSEVSLGGESAGRCFPTQLCAEPDEIRKLLYKGLQATMPEMPLMWENVKKTNPTRKNLEAIEVSICVDVKKIKKPESPYPVDESCVNCDILAMNDIMNKMLEKNVVPRENTMQAWGTSNRWGPTFSFNLNVVASRMKNVIFNPKKTVYTEKELTDMRSAQIMQKQTKKVDQSKESIRPSTTGMLSSMGVLSRDVDARDAEKEGYYRSLKNYRIASGPTGDQEVDRELLPLLNALKNSFSFIQGQYRDLATGSTLDEKKQCTF